MILTDTHTHLCSEEFDQDRTEMMQRAIAAGVSRFFIPSIDSSETQKMYDLEAQVEDWKIKCKSKENAIAAMEREMGEMEVRVKGLQEENLKVKA